jgi:hypothetical protein
MLKWTFFNPLFQNNKARVQPSNLETGSVSKGQGVMQVRIPAKNEEAL